MRVSLMKALPTDVELSELGHENAGALFAEMKLDRPHEYKAWVADHRAPWDCDWSDTEWEPKQQPHRALAHLIEILAHMVEAKTGGDVGNLEPSQLKKKSVEKFKALAGGMKK